MHFRHACILCALLSPAISHCPTSHGAIYRWDTGQLIPGMYAFNPIPGVVLDNANLEYADFTRQSPPLDLTGASFISSNLSKAYFFGSNLTSTKLWRANLTGANFGSAVLKDADLRVAIVTGAGFTSTTDTGFTKEQLYSTASYQAKELSGIGLSENDLSGWSFSGQNLTGASFYGATLTNADFSGAIVTRATFTGAKSTITGEHIAGATPSIITKSQLYATASYQAKNLRGVVFGEFWSTNDLTGWDFSGQDLTGASLYAATLTDANLTDAIVTGIDLTGTSSRGLTKEMLYSTASYKAKNLRGIKLGGVHNSVWISIFLPSDLSSWDFSGQDLTDARFTQANLTDANFTAAVVAGASFFDTTSRGFTKEQLYATASYQAKNLQGISWGRNELSGWDFHEQDLSGADFIWRTNLTNSYFQGANLMNSRFILFSDPSNKAILTNANLTAADLRGAHIASLTGTTARNAILPDGRIAGLELLAGDRLLVRDDDGLPAALPNGIPARLPIAVTVEDRAEFAEGGVLQLLFDADPWESQIAFEPGISVELGGALELSFADNVDVASQIGRTLKIFDWSGIVPTGLFEVRSSYVWDVEKLYKSGDVTLTSIPVLPGDFNQDGSVDAGDYVVWRHGVGTIYTQDDYNTWRAGFGQNLSAPGVTGSVGAAANSLSASVPEPAAVLLLNIVAIGLATVRPTRSFSLRWSSRLVGGSLAALCHRLQRRI